MMAARRWLPAALALVPLAYLIWMCATLHVDVPFWDAWELVPRLDRLDTGTLTVRDLWQQHNEHRPVFPMLLMLIMARLSRWNIGWEIAANVLCGIGIFAVWVRYVVTAWQSDDGPPLWLLPVFSVLIFSPFQWENWMWGWQITALMGTAAATLGTFLLATSGRSDRRFGWALACGVWSTYSFAAGLVFWGIALPVIALSPRQTRARRAAAWAVVTGVTLATYFYDYHRPAQPPMSANFASLAALRTFVVYIFKYLGAAIAGYEARLAALFGLAVAIAFVLLLVRLRPRLREPIYLFPTLIGLQTIGVAIISAAGRAWNGSDQALASRYGTISIALWCAAAALAMLAVRRYPVERARPLLRAALTAVLIAILTSASAVAAKGQAQAAARSEYLRIARRGLINGQSDAMLLRLYPDVAVIKERRAILRMLRVSVFRSGVSSY
jgi:hypothetical protein